MKNKFTPFLISLIAFAFIFPATILATDRVPIALVFSPKGKVEYSKNGKKWRKIRRKKFMFAGYTLRTGADGKVKVLNQKTSVTSQIEPNSLVLISPNQFKVLRGKLNKEQTGKTNMFSGLGKKFLTSQKLTQKYTTVRRSVKKNEVEGPKIKMPRKLTISEDHPYLVWDNPGADYSYQVKLKDQTLQVKASSEKLVRTQITPFNGTIKYQIVILKAGQPLFTTKQSKLNWLDTGADQEFKTGLKNLRSNPGFNSFFYAIFLENHGLLVAAMDKYREFIDENPDNNDMRPFLIRTYKKLRLVTLAKIEQDIYFREQEEE